MGASSISQVDWSYTRNDEGEVIGFVGVVYDVTERMALEQMKDEMISSVSHEMRTPLTAMLGFSEFLLENRVDEALLVHPSDDLPPVAGDEGRLHQVLNNLLSNAVKYSPPDGEITVGAKRDGDAVIIWVKDQGMGIPPEQVEKIFDKFYRIDSTDRRATGGTGLGLPLVREIVHAHGGRVWVDSAPGKGSTFYVSLPVAKEVSGIGA